MNAGPDELTRVDEDGEAWVLRGPLREVAWSVFERAWSGGVEVAAAIDPSARTRASRARVTSLVRALLDDAVARTPAGGWVLLAATGCCAPEVSVACTAEPAPGGLGPALRELVAELGADVASARVESRPGWPTTFVVLLRG